MIIWCIVNVSYDERVVNEEVWIKQTQKVLQKKNKTKNKKSAGKNGNDSSILKVTSHRREFYINYESLVRFYNPYDPITV